MRLLIIFIVVFWGAVFLLSGCAGTDCPDSDKYVAGYRTTTFHDGSVITEPFYYCR